MSKKRAAAHAFYADILKLIAESDIPFMVAGAFALKEYTGISRETKDLDLFCKTSDADRILKLLSDNNWKTEVTDPRWLSKAIHDDHFIDLIYSTPSSMWAVTDRWFKHAPTGDFFGQTVKYIPPEELLYSKLYIMDRGRFDGADVNHLFLKKSKDLDWKHIMSLMDHDWELLLAHIFMFRYVYPSDRDLIPSWVLNELLNRLKYQLDSPLPFEKICRGPLLSRTQYEIDTNHWGYKSFT